MNGPGADIHSRREGDQGRIGRVRAFYLRWKDPVFAIVLPPTAIATVVIGLQTRSYQESRARDSKVVRVLAQEQAKITRENAQRARETAASARLSCLRTKAFAPAVADDYERRGVLPSSVLDRYRASIPKSCPPG